MRYFTVKLDEEYTLQGGQLHCILADCPWDDDHPEW